MSQMDILNQFFNEEDTVEEEKDNEIVNDEDIVDVDTTDEGQGSDVPTTDIKVEGEIHNYESGAVRYDKEKGDFNLIPWNVVREMSRYIMEEIDSIEEMSTVEYYMLLMDSVSTQDFRRIILLITIGCYYYSEEFLHGNETFMAPKVTKMQMVDAFIFMLRDLAIHYQKGAKIYGEDNWRKGIGTSDGIPRKSFVDSCIRHTLQFLNGLVDEPHHVSAIWNAFAVLYIDLLED